MSRSRNILLAGTASERAPTDKELALRPEMVKRLLSTVSTHVDQFDIEHMVAIGITTDGSPRLFHSYGQDLALEDVAQLLENIAEAARYQANHPLPTQ